MISKISVNYGIHNNCPVTKTNQTTPLVSQTINKQNYTDNVSFEGIGFLFKAGIRRTPKTVEEVMKRLEKQESGTYGLKDGIFVPVIETRTKEAVIKGTPKIIVNGSIPYGICTIKDGQVIEYCKTFIPPNGYRVHDPKSITRARTGLSPSALINFLRGGLEKITVIADNGIQKVTLPADFKKRTDIIESLGFSEAAKSLQTAEIDSKHQVPPNYAEYLWGLAQELSKDVKGIKLEITRPAEKV